MIKIKDLDIDYIYLAHSVLSQRKILFILALKNGIEFEILTDLKQLPTTFLEQEKSSKAFYEEIKERELSSFKNVKFTYDKQKILRDFEDLKQFAKHVEYNGIYYKNFMSEITYNKFPKIQPYAFFDGNFHYDCERKGLHD